MGTCFLTIQGKSQAEQYGAYFLKFLSLAQSPRPGSELQFFNRKWPKGGTAGSGACREPECFSIALALMPGKPKCLQSVACLHRHSPHHEAQAQGDVKLAQQEADNRTNRGCSESLILNSGCGSFHPTLSSDRCGLPSKDLNLLQTAWPYLFPLR